MGNTSLNIVEKKHYNVERLRSLLNQDLDFHDADTGYSSHNFHSFPAKFPPQLPKLFIEGLTEPGDIILDPMMGSGTTILESYLTGRKGIGFDIDPLSFLLTKVKITPLNKSNVLRLSDKIIKSAYTAINKERVKLQKILGKRWDAKTKDFINYWFAENTQIELMALLCEIEKIKDEKIRQFFLLAISSIIITKSGGVSLALDLAHTRPHRAKIIFDEKGNIIEGSDYLDKEDKRIRFIQKRLHNALTEFRRRIVVNLEGLIDSDQLVVQLDLDELLKSKNDKIPPVIKMVNAQQLPLDNESVDLIFTSPPYASNAIDYMRAHKFSLVWLGYSIGQLGSKKKDYIGGENTSGFIFEELPDFAEKVIKDISSHDKRKGMVLHKYYSEMTRILKEMYRVLKPGKAAIIVVGNSILRNISTETHKCLAEIGQSLGFYVPEISVRNMDRNRRMMPAGKTKNLNSQIQKRMHEEYIIGLYKS